MSDRTRMVCPHHRRLCYGRVIAAYDTTRIVFDCGTFLCWGYGIWTKPGETRQRSAYRLRHILRLPMRVVDVALPMLRGVA
jgi:hypothetical protein